MKKCEVAWGYSSVEQHLPRNGGEGALGTLLLSRSREQDIS